VEKTIYSLYYLYDPRNNKVCYVGITNNPNRRFSQHNRPISTNQSKIAKLAMHLKTLGLKLEGKIIHQSYSRSYIEFLEKSNIRRLRNKYKNQIKNLQDGGYNSFGFHAESIKKMLETKKLNCKPIPRGESSNSNLKESDVIELYSLILDFYSNTEIVKRMEGKVTRTQVSMIRNGSNWNHLFVENKMFNLPSLPNNGGYTGKEKIEILDKISKGYDYETLSKIYTKLSKSDLKRIQNREIWDKVWMVYDNFFNQVNKIKNGTF
jgi:hypothetical protein